MTKKPNRVGLNPRKRATLLAIANLLETERWPPSFRQVGEVSGIGEAAIHYWIRLLNEDGYIERGSNARRAIALTVEGRKIVRQLRRKSVA